MNNEKKSITPVVLTEFIRIQDVIKWCIISFIGFLLGMSSLSLDVYIMPLLIFIIATFCIMSFTFGINNYYDADSDRENPRRKHVNAIASGKISKRTGMGLNILLIIIPLLICFLFKLEIFLFCALLLVWMYVYSAPPFRTKSRPILDVMWHLFGFFLLVLWGSFIAGSIDLISWLVAFSLGVFSSIGQVGNHISDYTFDKESGTTTFAVWTGLDKAKTTLNILTSLHLIVLIPLILLYTLSYYITIIFVISVAAIGFLILRPKKGVFPTKRCFTYYFAIVIGGAVYVSCLLYHLLIILGEPTLDLLPFIGIS